MGHTQSVSDNYSENDVEAILFDYKQIEDHLSIEAVIAGTIEATRTVRLEERLEKVESENEFLKERLVSVEDTMKRIARNWGRPAMIRAFTGDSESEEEEYISSHPHFYINKIMLRLTLTFILEFGFKV